MQGQLLQIKCFERGIGKLDEADDGILRGCKLVGLVSSNGRRYKPEALRNAIPKYEGAVVNIDHVEEGKDSVQRKLNDRFGRISNVTFRNGEGLFGDVRINPHHPMAEQVKWWARNDEGAAGFSHVAEGLAETIEGIQYVEAIEAVESVDLVANPATTKGFFESETGSLSERVRSASPEERRELLAILEAKEENAMDLSKLSISELRESRPDLVQSIVNDNASAADAVETKRKLQEAEARVKTLEAEIEIGKRRQRVLELCKEAGIPERGRTSIFIDSVCRLEKEEDVRAAIKEQAAAVGAKPPTDRDDDADAESFWESERPASREQRFTERFERNAGNGAPVQFDEEGLEDFASSMTS